MILQSSNKTLSIIYLLLSTDSVLTLPKKTKTLDSGKTFDKIQINVPPKYGQCLIAYDLVQLPLKSLGREKKSYSLYRAVDWTPADFSNADFFIFGICC